MEEIVRSGEETERVTTTDREREREKDGILLILLIKMLRYQLRFPSLEQKSCQLPRNRIKLYNRMKVNRNRGAYVK